MVDSVEAAETGSEIHLRAYSKMAESHFPMLQCIYTDCTLNVLIFICMYHTHLTSDLPPPS